MSDTSGLCSEPSSKSADLQQSLESRLQAAMDVTGSPEYALTWKRWDMPSGLPICALRASARRISDKDYSGWPTPTSKFKAGGEYADPEKARARALGPHANDLRDFAQLAGWATPTTRDWRDGRASQETMQRNARPLNEQATMLAGWPTPMAGSPGTDKYNPAGNTDSSRRTVALTPGQTLIGSSASTASTAGYRLNPNFSRWLMGFPADWANCAPTATPSSRK